MKTQSELKALDKTVLEAVRFTGYKPVYNGGQTQCPGCGGTNWMVGRSTAECSFCATALPLPDADMGRTALIQFRNRFRPSATRGAFTINGKAA